MKGATSYCTISGCAVRSLAAGADLILLGRYIKPLKMVEEISQGVEEQELQDRVEESARKVFLLKEKMGLLSEDKTVVPLSQAAYKAVLAKISDRAVTLVRDRAHLLPFAPKITAKKPTVCAVFFAPARFADQLLGLSQPFLEKGWKVRSYNAALTPKEKDYYRAAQCANGADLVVLTSLQWADRANSNQKQVIDELLTENKNVVLISTMSPYDIVQYPQAGTVLATYGINKYVLNAAARIILGTLQPQGVMPVALPSTAASAGMPRTHTPPVGQR